MSQTPESPREPSDELQIEDRHGVRHVILNRPDKLNVLSMQQHARVIDAVEVADRDDTVRVVAFSGRGRAFCAGDDLTGGGNVPERWRGRSVPLEIGMGPTALLDVCAVIRQCSKPTVALMHGHALGSGYDYSLSCDFRVATSDLNYGDPRIHRALWAAEGWSYKLVRQLNLSQVTPIAYLGKTMTGEQGYELGLIHRVFPAASELRQEAAPFLDELAGLDSQAYAISKRRLLRALDQDFATALSSN